MKLNMTVIWKKTIYIKNILFKKKKIIQNIKLLISNGPRDFY